MYAWFAPHPLRLVQNIGQWVLRVDYACLTHCALRGDRDGQQKLAAEMKGMFPDIADSNLEAMGYLDCLKIAKSHFANIPRKGMRPSLAGFLDRMLNYLSPGVVIGVGPLDAFTCPRFGPPSILEDFGGKK